MKINIRRAEDKDRKTFINFAAELSKFSRKNHCSECKTDDYSLVISNIRAKAYETFINRNNNKVQILIAEWDNEPVGYALAEIYEEDIYVDNGTGKVGLFDELLVHESARGQGIGQLLLEEVMNWFKDNHIKRVKLHAYTWNSGAIKLYERNNFKAYVTSYQCFIE